MLREEIKRCMQQLEFDENNNPNHSANFTIKTDAPRPPIPARSSGNFLPAARAPGDLMSMNSVPAQEQTSMSSLLQKYQHSRPQSGMSGHGKAAHNAYLNQLLSGTVSLQSNSRPQTSLNSNPSKS